MLRVKKDIICIIVLIAYIVFIFFYAVLSRNSGVVTPLRLELFWGYNNPPEHIYKDNILNIISFIPIGVLTGLIFKKNGLLKVMFVGLGVSLTIELSQLIWKRGVFDVDDLFNNTVGAIVGGLLVWTMLSVMEKRRVRD